MRDAIRSDSLLVLLRRLALESAHQELADVPLLFWGHSRFGSFGAGFARAHPERTIGYVAYQSGGAAPELKLLSRLPALFIQGGRDTAVLGNPRAEWLSGRAVNAPWSFAVQPDATHGDQEELK